MLSLLHQRRQRSLQTSEADALLLQTHPLAPGIAAQGSEQGELILGQAAGGKEASSRRWRR